MTTAEGKVCIVTGAAQGIGAAYARAMAAEGADVAIIDLKRIDQAVEVEAAIKELGGRSLALKADVTDAEQMSEAVATIVGEFGRVDCLVNNAALMFDQLTATWDDFLAVNFMGIVNASNAVVPYLWEQGSGSIVNISSTAAFPIPLPAMLRPGADSPPPAIDPSGYGITKWMVIYQTRHMAQMLGSPQHPRQRGGARRDDVAGDQGRRARSRSSTCSSRALRCAPRSNPRT